MSPTWEAGTYPAPVRVGPMGWVRVVLRGLALLAVLGAGVLATLVLRPLEARLHGLYRPWTQHITVWVCRSAFVILGIRHSIEGRPMTQTGAVVANHSSWLDIFTLNAAKRLYFVSKSEVAGWPGIGFLARLTGTVFINRDPREARAQQQVFRDRLLAGHKLLFFPEGTSTDGLRVLPFKSTLFEAFRTEALRDRLSLQPVSVIYTAPAGAQDARFYGWWGDMDLAPHLLQVLAQSPQGAVRVVYHEPVRVADFVDRKTLARALEARVRAGMPADRQLDV